MTGKRFSTFPLRRTTGIMWFTDPALTTSINFVPVHKKQSIANYRPISLLPIYEKSLKVCCITKS